MLMLSRRLLELLDLSFNYFGTEPSVEAVISLPRLLTVMLYGNPVLGPTGEDPMFIYIEGLVERAADIRDASGSNLKDIEVRQLCSHHLRLIVNCGHCLSHSF